MATIGLVGCAHIHTPNFVDRLAKRPEIQVKAVWDGEVARSTECAEKLGAAVAPSAQSIFDDKAIDAVIICSQTHLHRELVLPAVAARKHLFVEKPLGFTAADALEMAQAIESAGLIFQTGYFTRSQAAMRFVKEAVDKGHFGTITRARFSNCHCGSLKGWFDTKWRWMTDPAVAGCGAYGDLGTHGLDILLWMLGKVERVTASIQSVTGRYGAVDESGEGLIQFARGAVATLAAGWVDVADPVKLLISGTEGHAAILNGQLYFSSSHVEGADGKTPWTALPAELPHAFELFLNALAGQAGQPLVTPAEAAYRNVVMEALYQGAAQGRWIAVG